jgi:hypothetical protein
VSINRDPNGVPEMPPGMMLRAREYGCHVVHVICDPDGPPDEAWDGASFFAMTAFLPRPDDKIMVAGGKVVQVRRVFFNIIPGPDGQMLAPTVYAIEVKKPERGPAGE